MSFEAAVGRIGQILQLQQSILDPASAGASSSTSGAAASTTSGASTDFATALASAQSGTAGTGSSLSGAASNFAGASGIAGTGTVSGGVSASGTSDPRVAAMVNEANSLVGKPYVYGGGHSGWGPQAGYDCSGFVSAVLHAGGYLSSPQDTTSLPSQAGMESGPGQHVTVYDRALPGQSGHVIIDIDGQFYESGGMHGSWGGGGGVEKIATPSASYLATFPTVLHPSGL
jgi:cell wall-associated NlpC family hydrolase